MFNLYVSLVLDFVRTSTKEICSTEDQNLVNSLMWLFRSLMSDYEDETKYAEIERKNLITGLQSKFIFALVWSIGGSLTTEARKPFDTYLKRLLNGDFVGGDKRKRLQFPERGMLYDYCINLKESGETDWVKWLDTINNADEIPAKSLPHQIIIKTNDTVRYSYLLKLNIRSGNATLFCGPTGTGKTVYIKNVLLNELDKAVFTTVIEVGFSAQTSSTQTQ